ncbi:hypothetical protein ACLHFD_001997 [Vibrio alginolyticus]
MRLFFRSYTNIRYNQKLDIKKFPDLIGVIPNTTLINDKIYNDPIWSPPLIINDKCFLLTYCGRVKELSHNMELIDINVNLLGSVYASSVVFNNEIFIATTNGWLAKYDLQFNLISKIKCGYYFATPPVIIDGCIYLQDFGNKIHVIDRVTLTLDKTVLTYFPEELAKYKSMEDNPYAHLVDLGYGLACCSYDVLHFYDYQMNEISTIKLNAPVYSTPALLGDFIIVSDVCGNIYKIDIASFKIEGILKLKGSVRCSGVINNLKFIIVCESGFLYSIDVLSFSIDWSKQINQRLGYNTLSLINESIIFTGHHGALLSYISNDGEFCWEADNDSSVVKLDGKIVTSPYFFRNMILGFTEQGNMLVYKLRNYENK